MRSPFLKWRQGQVDFVHTGVKSLTTTGRRCILHSMRRDNLLSLVCLSTHDRVILLGHILAERYANKPGRDRPRLSLVEAEIKTSLPPQLDGQADCWPTLESEINLFLLMRENMQTSRRARGYAKPWQEGGWCFCIAIGWREAPPPEEAHPPISPRCLLPLRARAQRPEEKHSRVTSLFIIPQLAESQPIRVHLWTLPPQPLLNVVLQRWLMVLHNTPLLHGFADAKVTS